MTFEAHGAPAGRHTFAGLFATTLATLTYQLLLTRIFSVTMYYHFAFVAISVTMFGMAVGALIVYQRPQVFTAGRIHAHLARAALGFALTIVGSFLAHIWLPFRPELSLYGVTSVVLTYAVLSVPFTFSGIVVALALTRFPRQVSALYGVDLAGAALGCALLGPLLRVTDGPTAILATAAIAAFGAVLFSSAGDSLPAEAGSYTEPDLPAEAGSYTEPDLPPKAGSYTEPDLPPEAGSYKDRGRGFRLPPSPRHRRTAVASAEAGQPEENSRRFAVLAAAVTVLLVLATIANTIAARRDHPWLRLVWVKGNYEARPIVERWNPFSRVRVIGNPTRAMRPSGWGFSTTLPSELTARELHLDIDSYAGTELTAFNGDPASVQHLKYDVTNVAHYIRPSSNVLVVGTGGGRDILSALVFGQRAVTGVEINPSILELVNGRFGDFTGHLDRDPHVRFVNDEARSYLARMRDPVDLIQISLIDTWAATASGAFVLTENSLYTLEAWTNFLNRLTRRGVLSVSRWYYADRPGEVYRSAVLAATTLQKRGVKRPGDHLVIVRARPTPTSDAPDGIGTILVSPEPFSAADLDALDAVAARLRFEVVQSPRISRDETFAAIADADRLAALLEHYPLDISAPTDDSPFFFHMLRLRDVFNLQRWRDQGIVSFNMKAVGVLGVLLATVTLMTAACILLPLVRTRRTVELRGAVPHLVYFAAIGFGFMLVEISQLQRLTIFLGHPAYSLSVVLFSLLVSSGVGSLATGRIADGQAGRATRQRLLIILAVLVVFGIATPAITHRFEGADTPVRILIAVGILLPVGFYLGMAFPLGMRLALQRSTSIAPWLWGVNGATSVCASVLAVVIAIGAGISAAFWVGAFCYALAVFAASAGIKSQAPNPRLQRTPNSQLPN